MLGLLVPPAALAGPDPVQKPVLDGCQRNPAGLLTFTSPEWVRVDGAKAQPFREIRGKATLVHTADEDLPEGHDSYDLDWDVIPDPGFEGLLAGSPEAGNGNYGDDADKAKLHVEWESKSVPAYAWPTENDTVDVWGQWIWDCGHWGQGIQTDPDNPQEDLIGTGDYFLPGQVEGGAPQELRGEQTELHPIEGFAVHRAEPSQSTTGESQTDVFASNDGTHAYADEKCAAQDQVQNSFPNSTLPAYGPEFTACINDPANQRQPIAGRSFSFFVPAPPRPSPGATLRWREVEQVAANGASEQVTPRGDGIEVRVSFDPSADAGPSSFGASYFVGWKGRQATSTPLRLTLQSVTVNHSLDPNPKRQTQSGPPPGEYNLYLDVNGVWNFIGGHGPLSSSGDWAPGLGQVSDGQTFAVNRDVVFYVPAGGPVRVDISGRECDLPRMDPCVVTGEVSDANDHPGHAIDSFPTAGAALGDHTLISPVDADYALRYRVTRAAPGTPPTGCGSTGVGASSPGGSLGGAGQVKCLAASCDAGAPTSAFAGRQRSTRRRFVLRGRASDVGCAGARRRLRRVEVALARRVGHRCRYLRRNARFGRAASCARRTFLRARGTTRWRLVRRRHFPRGRYVAYVRGVDRSGNVETRVTPRNRRALRVR
jgi:hypothetical protein